MTGSESTPTTRHWRHELRRLEPQRNGQTLAHMKTLRDCLTIEMTNAPKGDESREKPALYRAEIRHSRQRDNGKWRV